jgi:5-methylcytosine-specific restriction endonuclease McrA
MAIKDREKYNQYMRDYLRERWRIRRANAIFVLGGRCVECLTTNKLEFDHIEPEEKAFNVSRASTWAIERFWTEIDKCQLLCEDCHKEKTILYLKTLIGREPGNKIHNPVHGTGHMYNKLKCRCGECKNWKSLYRKQLVDSSGNFR